MNKDMSRAVHESDNADRTNLKIRESSIAFLNTTTEVVSIYSITFHQNALGNPDA
jgi:hypothetical protein